MHHIDEGLHILTQMGASKYAKNAYTLHPMIQADDDLLHNLDSVIHVTTPRELAYLMEYRNLANRYLSTDDTSNIKLSPLESVNHMLVADKVQNYKDFLLYHASSHPRAAQLTTYFKNWLKALSITTAQYEALIVNLNTSEVHEHGE